MRELQAVQSYANYKALECLHSKGFLYLLVIIARQRDMSKTEGLRM